jgi:5-methylcytosine-specific restriction protein A
MTGRPYDRQRWRRLRREQLQREPLCRMHREQGEVLPAEQVDHIRAMSAGGAFDDPENLQSLCPACHSHKTRSEQTGREPRPRVTIDPETGWSE